MLASYNDEFNWRQKHKGEDIFEALLKMLSRTDATEDADATEDVSPNALHRLP